MRMDPSAPRAIRQLPAQPRQLPSLMVRRVQLRLVSRPDAQEHRACREAVTKLKPSSSATARKKFSGKLDKQATTIAGLAIGCYGTAMCQAGERGDRRFDDPVTRHVIEIRDQSKTATVALVRRVIETFCKSLRHRHALEESRAFARPAE